MKKGTPVEEHPGDAYRANRRWWQSVVRGFAVGGMGIGIWIVIAWIRMLEPFVFLPLIGIGVGLAMLGAGSQRKPTVKAAVGIVGVCMLLGRLLSIPVAMYGPHMNEDVWRVVRIHRGYQNMPASPEAYFNSLSAKEQRSLRWKAAVHLRKSESLESFIVFNHAFFLMHSVFACVLAAIPLLLVKVGEGQVE